MNILSTINIYNMAYKYLLRHLCKVSLHISHTKQNSKEDKAAAAEAKRKEKNAREKPSKIKKRMKTSSVENEDIRRNMVQKE